MAEALTPGERKFRKAERVQNLGAQAVMIGHRRDFQAATTKKIRQGGGGDTPVERFTPPAQPPAHGGVFAAEGD